MHKRDLRNDQQREGLHVEQQRHLVFTLANQEYAVPLLEVKEVIALAETTAIPYAPTYFRGVINLRGQVISVIDLRSKLNLGVSARNTVDHSCNQSETAIIILDVAPHSLGVIVDSIDSVLSLSPGDMSPPPEVGGSAPSSALAAIARKDKRLILVLEASAILNDQDLQAIKQQLKQTS